MTSNIHYGIRRLVLLNTESYSLGDFPLDRPLSISATNNVGKSTAINALQFPFLCNRRDMVFPKDEKETLKYYFPYENSYVLSEVLTDNGLYVLGAAGNGPLSGYEYQLFAFKKELDLFDFLVDDPGQGSKKSIRTLKELERHLGRTDVWVKRLKPKQMQDALIGKEITIQGNEKFSIGLFRLKSLTDKNYRLFMNVFKNLLHMNDFSMEEVKMFLINALLPSWDTVSGDFMTEYREYNQSFEKDRNKIKTAESISKEVARLALLKAEHDILGQFLSSTYKIIENRYQKERDLKRADLGKLKIEFKEIENLIIKVEKEIEIFGDQSRKRYKIKEGLKDRLGALEKKDLHFKLSPSLETRQEQLVSLEKQRDKIIGELAKSSVDPARRIQQKINICENQIAKLNSQLKHIKSNLLFLIKDSFDESEIGILMKLINKQIFTSFTMNEGDLNIHDEKGLIQNLKQVLSCCENGFYNDGNIKINLAKLDSISLEDYFNHGQIQNNLENAVQDLTELQGNLNIALNFQQKEKEKDEIEKKLRQQARDLGDYKCFLEEKKKRPDIEKECVEATDSFNGVEEKLKKKNAEKFKLAQRKIGDGQKIKEKETSLFNMEKEFGKVAIVKGFEGDTPYHEAYNLNERVQSDRVQNDRIQVEIEKLIHEYVEKQDKFHDTKKQIESIFSVIEARGGSRFANGRDISAQIKSLQEQTDKESIKNYRQVLKNTQEARSQELGAMLKNLAKQLDLFKHEVSRFNNEMNKHQISNIENIKFIVDEDNNILGTIKKLILEDTIFGGSRHIDKVVENLNHIITRKGVSISLPNLFNLGVFLKLENGKEIESFGKGSIESTGTDLTIKVVLNVMLLSRILHVKQNHLLNLPAYIDEAGQIDPINQQTLIDQCAKAGFIPVFASVEAQSTAEYWIGLKEVDGKICVTKDDWFRLTPKPLEASMN
ncbi:MAG: hypothetical protein PF503_05080 [Desulfobacula sp.]|jgi:hypothetical protein|nr:hypothetical protein [Desulfobacula sp.]